MMGDGQPLPQSDEVLVCNTDTTLDEVSNPIINPRRSQRDIVLAASVRPSIPSVRPHFLSVRNHISAPIGPI